MKTLAVIGANGFVGSALVRQGIAAGFSVTPITRENYDALKGEQFDTLVDAAGNSRKYLADQEPREDFRQSVEHRVQTLLDFRAEVHLHVSSVDVYEDLTSPETTREDRIIDVSRPSRYGFHKLLAEEIVRHYANDWLIVRLAGMVGPGLRKNPVYDILHELPLRIHPESRYQFMATDDAAQIALSLLKHGARRETYNVCGSGLVSPAEIATLAGRRLDLSEVDPAWVPRIVSASVAKIETLGYGKATQEAINRFVTVV